MNNGDNMEIDSFLSKVRDINGVLRLTIPKNLVTFMGLKPGEVLKVYVKKIKYEEDDI